MSDRVENMLVVLGSLADREQFQTKAKGKVVNYKGERDMPWKSQPLCFNNFVRVPEHLLALPRWGNTHSDEEECGGNWECRHWGCNYGPMKMGLHDAPPEGELLPDLLMYYFDTINAVAVEAFKAISAEWPTLRLELFWQAEWEVYDPTHLCVFAGGELIEDRATTVNMYHFWPRLQGDEKAAKKGYYTNWTRFRDAVSADWLPEWSEVRAEVERAINGDENNE